MAEWIVTGTSMVVEADTEQEAVERAQEMSGWTWEARAWEPCPDCEGGKVDGIPCATCEPEPDAFNWTILPDGSVRLVRADLPGVANEDKFAVVVSARELAALMLASRIEQLGGTDRTGEL